MFMDRVNGINLKCVNEQAFSQCHKMFNVQVSCCGVRLLP
jgi:hypothetical protein